MTARDLMRAYPAGLEVDLAKEMGDKDHERRKNSGGLHSRQGKDSNFNSHHEATFLTRVI